MYRNGRVFEKEVEPYSPTRELENIRMQEQLNKQRQEKETRAEAERQKEYEFKQHNLTDTHKDLVDQMKALRKAKEEEKTEEQIKADKLEQEKRVYQLLERKHNPEYWY